MRPAACLSALLCPLLAHTPLRATKDAMTGGQIALKVSEAVAARRLPKPAQVGHGGQAKRLMGGLLAVH
jgi:hypothetical protein